MAFSRNVLEEKSKSLKDIMISYLGDFRGRYRISRKGGVGCRGYGYFILALSVVGHITRCTDKMSVDKILGDQTPIKIARRGRGQNAVHFMGQGGQNAYLNKTLYI